MSGADPISHSTQPVEQKKEKRKTSKKREKSEGKKGDRGGRASLVPEGHDGTQPDGPGAPGQERWHSTARAGLRLLHLTFHFPPVINKGVHVPAGRGVWGKWLDPNAPEDNSSAVDTKETGRNAPTAWSTD